MIILLTASLLLVGCVRPVPEPEVATPAEPDASDPEVGGGTINDPTPPPVTVTAVTSEIDPYPAAVTEAAPIVETATATPETAAQPAASTATPTPAVMATKSSAETAVPLPPSAAADCPKTHVVQPGENLFRIGLQYGLSW
ncbi:MAG: hypothetical protein M5U34_23560 [Chloroflexi bacterium]|nr:hypothetical protein [Chloroflexota bacterium]